MFNLGIDLGGTNIAAGLVNDEYKIVQKASIPTFSEKGVETVVERIAQVSNKVISDYGITLADIDCIGVGTPGVINNDKGEVVYANNLNFLHVPLISMLKTYFGDKKICIGNDADVAAFGEYKAGAAKGTDNAMTITLGTGIGGGWILNGKIYNGFNHAGAEFGHIVIKENGRQCTCGRKGCWETYASVTGLIRTTIESMEQHPESAMWKFAKGDTNNVCGITAFDAMRDGDAAAKEVVRSYQKSIAVGLVNVMNIIQPKVLCIGGGISKEGDTLLDPIREIVHKEIYARHMDTVTDLRIAKLNNDAGIIGAALLGLQ